MPATKPERRDRQRGFTYIGMLILVVLFGLTSVVAAQRLASSDRAERERELLFIGQQFTDALRSYRAASAGLQTYPPSLDDLVLDKRQPTPRRHLRKIYLDPITAKPGWGLVMAPGGGIMGVYSLSMREPMKRHGFTAEQQVFEQIAATRRPGEYSYRDWQFVHQP